MKRYQVFLICLFAAAYTHAHTNAIPSDAESPQSAPTQQSAATADPSAQALPAPSKLRHKSVARSSLSKIKRGVVKEIRATSAFVQQQAAKSESSDGWLIALTLMGMVVLQLRRKHKSLPQRRIAPYV
jgi:hypothetical protein